MITSIFKCSEDTISFPIVLATATPKMKGPLNSATAVIANATRRPDGARGDHGGNDVARIVDAIEEIKADGQDDQNN